MKKTLYISACAPVADGGGIYRCTLEDGRLCNDAYYPCDRPMYTIIADGRLHVILRQVTGETGGYFSIGLDFENRSEIIDSRGIVPCHLAVSGGEVWWVNYLSGNVVKNDGTTMVRSGSGPNAKRQDMPHTHFVSRLDENCLGVCDLGTDTLAVYDRSLNLLDEAHVPAGYGIRHFVHDKERGLIYSINELIPSVSVFSYKDGALTYRSTLGLPCTNPAASGAAIRLSDDGETILVSLREENAICLLDAGETPVLRAKLSSFGDSPRDFILIDDLLVCTNEKSNSVAVVDTDGVCKDTLPLPGPLCVSVAE